MRFEANDIDPEMVNIINVNIARIEEWLMSDIPLQDQQQVIILDDEFERYPFKKRTRDISQPVRRRRRDLEGENLNAHAKSLVPYPPFILP